MKDVVDLISNKKEVMRFLLKAITDSDKFKDGLRSSAKGSDDHRMKVLEQVVANQAVQIKHLSILALLYAQGDSMGTDAAKMMNKMGRGEEALRAIINDKFK